MVQEIQRELEAMDGVAAVSVRGGLEREILVEPREDWLAARGIVYLFGFAPAKPTIYPEHLPSGVRRGEGHEPSRIRTETTSLRHIGCSAGVAAKMASVLAAAE